MFIVVLTYTKSIVEIDKHVAAHRKFLDIYYHNGQFLCSGPQVPREGGIIVCKAESREALETIIGQDPFHKHNLSSYQILEFDALKFAPQFEAFFK